MNPFRLRIAGIGGQGTVHLAKTLAAAAAASGVKVTMIERPRSAMRLGPITCDLCFQDPEFAPFITPGDADAVLGMEPLDGVLNAEYYIKKNGTVILQSEETPTVDEFVLLQRDPRRDEWKQELHAEGGKPGWPELLHAGRSHEGVSAAAGCSSGGGNPARRAEQESGDAAFGPAGGGLSTP